MLLLLLDPSIVFASEFLDFLSACGGLRFVFGPPDLHFALGFDELAFEVQTGLAFFLKLHTDGFEFDLNLVQLGFEEGAASFVVFSATAGVFELTSKLALQIGGVLQIDLKRQFGEISK